MRPANDKLSEPGSRAKELGISNSVVCGTLVLPSRRTEYVLWEISAEDHPANQF